MFLCVTLILLTLLLFFFFFFFAHTSVAVFTAPPAFIPDHVGIDFPRSRMQQFSALFFVTKTGLEPLAAACACVHVCACVRERERSSRSVNN